jgi:hypothetical protein
MAEPAEFRVVWTRGSDAHFQLGRTEGSALEAERHGKGQQAARLRAEGCRLRIECRPVGSWQPWSDPPEVCDA